MRLLSTLGALALAASALVAQPQPAPTKTPPAKPAAAKPAATKPAATKPAAATQTLLDINTATAAELQQVPGIGATYAAKIVAGRPYKSKAELTSKKILPAGVYAKVKDRLVAKQK